MVTLYSGGLKFFEKNDLDGAAGHLKLLPYTVKL